MHLSTPSLVIYTENLLPSCIPEPTIFRITFKISHTYIYIYLKQIIINVLNDKNV